MLLAQKNYKNIEIVSILTTRNIRC